MHCGMWDFIVIYFKWIFSQPMQLWYTTQMIELYYIERYALKSILYVAVL